MSIGVAAGIEIEEDSARDVPCEVFLYSIPATAREKPGAIDYPQTR
jgi:hypothetical protein